MCLTRNTTLVSEHALQWRIEVSAARHGRLVPDGDLFAGTRVVRMVALWTGLSTTLRVTDWARRTRADPRGTTYLSAVGRSEQKHGAQVRSERRSTSGRNCLGSTKFGLSPTKSGWVRPRVSYLGRFDQKHELISSCVGFDRVGGLELAFASDHMGWPRTALRLALQQNSVRLSKRMLRRIRPSLGLLRATLGRFGHTPRHVF